MFPDGYKRFTCSACGAYITGDTSALSEGSWCPYCGKSGALREVLL